MGGWGKWGFVGGIRCRISRVMGVGGRMKESISDLMRDWEFESWN